jgi:hypothetical protein
MNIDSLTFRKHSDRMTCELVNDPLIDAYTIICLDGRRIVWSGSCETPYYHLLCEKCSWLSPASMSAGDLMEQACAACAARRDGQRRGGAFILRLTARVRRALTADAVRGESPTRTH